MQSDDTAPDVEQGFRDVLLFTTGAVIGAVLALLFAPQSGTRTRRQIVRTYEDVRDQAADLCEDVVDRVESLRRTAARQVGAGKEFVGEKRDEFLNTLSEVEKSIGGLAEKFRKY